MNQIVTIGLDLAKNIFQVHGIDACGKVVVRKPLGRGEVMKFFAGLPPCLIGIEACATAHHWGRELGKLGHTVRLMPPAYVKAYVKRGKTDAADAEAICEAVTRPTMRSRGLTIDMDQVSIGMALRRKSPMSAALDQWICLEIRAFSRFSTLFSGLICRIEWKGPRPSGRRQSFPQSFFHPKGRLKHQRDTCCLQNNRTRGISATEARWRALAYVHDPTVVHGGILNLTVFHSDHKTRLQRTVCSYLLHVDGALAGGI